MPSAAPAPTDALWSRGRALLLVLVVLVAHLGLMGGSAQWFSPHDTRLAPPKTWVTRHIPLPSAPATPHAAAPATRAAAPADTAEPSHTPATPPSHDPDAAQSTARARLPELDHLHPPLDAPVALPARSAEALDLPPYPRAAPETSGGLEATAYKAPASARLRYDVKGQSRHLGYSAWGDLDWQQDGQSYTARLEVGAFLLGSRVQTSAGVLGHDGLMPTRFSDKTRSELAAHFQRDKNIISFSANTPDAPLLKGAQDRLSVVLQLGALLSADPARYPAGTMLSMQTVSQREAEVWQFVVEHDEQLELPYDNLATVKLQRTPRREFDQRIELWLAPSLGYLPARLRITNANGDVVDQLLRSLTRTPP